MKMTVRDLILILEQQNPDEEVFLEYQGYHNYDYRTGTYREDEVTGVAKHNGKLFLCADCVPIVDY